MKKTKVMKVQTGLLVVLLMASFGAGSLTAQVTAESDTWEGFYEADASPIATADILGEAGWEDLSNGSGNTIVVPDGSNNYINYKYSHGDGAGSYEGFRYLGNTDGVNGGAADPDVNLFSPQTNGGISIEFRIRVTSGTFLMHMWTSSADAGRWLTIYVSDTNIQIRDSDDVNTPTGVGNTNEPSGEWTTFRVTCDDTTWRVYRDTDQSVQTSIPVNKDHGPYGLYQFALYGAQSYTVFDLDFIRWTNEGALSPGQAVPQCGDSGFKASDFNLDCYVNLADFQYIADEWMECTDPANAACDQFYL